MSVLLIDPPRGAIDKGNIWGALKRNLPSLGLAYMAAVLETKGHSVSVLDMNVEGFNKEDLIKRIRDGKYGFVGITATTVQINSALFIARHIKESFPGIKIILGGPHPNVMLEDVLSDKCVDYVVRGEGEFTMLEIAEGKEPGAIEGLSYRKNGRMIHNPARPVIKDLDILPLPARHLIPMDKYGPTPGNYKRLPAASMVTSRGCPGKCTFCNTDIFGKSIRFHSAENIAREIVSLIKDYNVKEVSFYDDTFTVSRKNVERLCDIIIKDRIDITWSCMSRIDCINPDMLRKMKKAGCHSICYGIESADENILSNINKKISLNRVPEFIKWTKDAGIDVRVSFMLGSPGETEETLKKTIQYAISLRPDIFIYNITTPLPGTEMFRWAREKGYLKTLEWDDYNLGRAVMDLPTVSAETVEKYYKIAYRKSYLRPSYFIQRLGKIKSYDLFILHLKLLKEMFFNKIFAN